MSRGGTHHAHHVVVAALLAAPGCIAVTVPGHAPMGTFTPLSPESAPTGGVFAEAAFWPTTGANLRLPASENNVVELGGQVSTTSYAVTPGLWIRDPESSGDLAVAHRVGLEAGQGDLLGIYPYQMPFVGGSYHFQSSRQKKKHIATTTIGLSAVTPLSAGDDLLSASATDFVVVTWPCAYFAARWSWAWPLGDSGDHLVLGAGLDVEVGLVAVSILATPIVPSPTLGLSWSFGPPRKTDYAPPPTQTD